MKSKVTLRAGTPDDDNRTYLPESIKGSDIVVNENGNNSQPYPERLKECHGVIADGLEDTWYEYVPASCDPAKKVPLVIGNHGGLMTGWGHAIYTSWTLVADREGFIAVFPDAHSLRMWQVKGVFDNFDPRDAPDLPIQTVPENMEDNHDMNFLLGLIEQMKKKYNIDEGRVFMQGMSMGNLMTTQFSRYYGHVLAGAAGSGGPTRPDMLFDKDGAVINEAGPLAIWQSRPENNGTPPGKQYSEFTVNKYSRFYWMKINECDPIPQISIVGENNFAFYKGKKADLVYLDIKNRDHGQTLDEAFLYWDYLFSGTRREPDGTIVHTDTLIPRTGDPFAIALTDDCDKAWFGNSIKTMSRPAIRWQKLKYHGLNGGQKVRGEYLCAPLSFLCEAFGARYEPSQDTLSAAVTLADGRALQFARGSIGCVIDDDVRSMYCEALHRDGELHVSVEWFCRYLLNLQVSTCNGVVYVTDHFAELSTFMADLIKDLLTDRAFPKDFKDIDIGA